MAQILILLNSLTAAIFQSNPIHLICISYAFSSYTAGHLMEMYTLLNVKTIKGCNSQVLTTNFYIISCISLIFLL